MNGLFFVQQELFQLSWQSSEKLCYVLQIVFKQKFWDEFQHIVTIVLFRFEIKRDRSKKQNKLIVGKTYIVQITVKGNRFL